VGFGSRRIRQAIALDSNFALAQSHIGLTYGWLRFGTDSLRACTLACRRAQRRARVARQHADRRGLAAKRRLRLRGIAQYRAHVGALFATLRGRPSRYEQDAKRGIDWRRILPFRHRAGAQRPEAEILPHLRSFDLARFRLRPAYIHPVELGFSIGDSARALRYARRYFALLPSDVSAAGTLLAAR
jgi:hypothetical protein